MSDDDKPSLAQAIRLLAERDRRTLGAHPKIEDLAAYHAGELSPEAEARLREHLAVCHECSDLLLDLINFADLAPPPGEPDLTDEEMEEDWQALRARMGVKTEEKPPAPVVPIRPAAATPAPAPPRRTWLPVAASLLAVLGFSYGLYQNGRVADLEQEIRDRQQVRGVSISYLDAGINRSGEQVETRIASQQDALIILHPYSDQTFERHEAEVVRGQEVVVRPPLAPSEDRDSVPLLIPKGSLEPGSYQIRLYGIAGDRRVETDAFPLQVDGP